jgi:hypothetical protein
VREDDVAALVDGAGFQFGAGAADGVGVGMSAASFSGRALFDRSWRGFPTPVAAATQDLRSSSEPLYQNNETQGSGDPRLARGQLQRRGQETRAQRR